MAAIIARAGWRVIRRSASLSAARVLTLIRSVEAAQREPLYRQAYCRLAFAVREYRNVWDSPLTCHFAPASAAANRGPFTMAGPQAEHKGTGSLHGTAKTSASSPQRKRKRIDVTNSADTARARAEAVFRTIAPAQPGATSPPQQSAMQEYRAKQQAELDKAARLRAMRLAKAQ